MKLPLQEHGQIVATVFPAFKGAGNSFNESMFSNGVVHPSDGNILHAFGFMAATGPNGSLHAQKIWRENKKRFL